MKNEINKFEELANNTTKAKDKINTKLTECGGTSATDLANVPLKIIEMLDGYFKLAEGEFKKDLTVIADTDGATIGYQVKKVNIPISLNFTPKRVIIYAPLLDFALSSHKNSPIYNISVDSVYNNSLKNGVVGNWNEASVYISNISSNNIAIALRVKRMANDAYATTLKAPIHWLALG